MMVDMLLDTTLFNDLRKGDPGARKVVEAILDDEIKAAVSPLTVCEIWQSNEIDRRSEIAFLSVLRFVEEVAPDIETARAAGLMLGDLSNECGRNGCYLAFVATTAIRRGIPICTRDVEAFERFDVEIKEY